ncbi:dihydroneopterin aldolase [Candidatus Sumerlaeota bacterium]|nr:dihydroneopterin aldolase [Candidatus Sumerlaeota bacterium]
MKTSQRDSITLHNMSFYAYHGVTPAERRVGQRFYLDVTIWLDLRRPGHTDDVRDTADYAKVYQVISSMTLAKRYHLIEALAQDIADNILAAVAPIEAVEVTVRKPQVSLGGILDHVSVTIYRERTRTD